MSVKVALVGNVCNNHFTIARALRGIGIDAHLFLTDADRGTQSLPESEDPSIAGNYPNWIHVVRGDLFSLIDKNGVREILQADVVHSHGQFAWFFVDKVPTVIHPFGADFYILPFKPLMAGRFGWLPAPRGIGLRKRMRHAYRHASAIVLSGYDRHWDIGYQHLIQGKRMAVVPLAIDLAVFPFGHRSRRFFAPASSTFVVLQTARQLWTPRTSAIEGSKGNDVLIRGFAAFARGHSDAMLVLVDKADWDTTASRDLIQSLSLENHVRWVPKRPRAQLPEYLHSCHVLVDCLRAGGYGSSVLEAMSCGAPVLMNLDESVHRELFDGDCPPIVNTEANEDHVARCLQECASRADLKSIAEEQREFVIKHHHPQRVADRLAGVYESVLGRSSDVKWVDSSVLVGKPNLPDGQLQTPSRISVGS